MPGSALPPAVEIEPGGFAIGLAPPGPSAARVWFWLAYGTFATIPLAIVAALFTDKGLAMLGWIPLALLWGGFSLGSGLDRSRNHPRVWIEHQELRAQTGYILRRSERVHLSRLASVRAVTWVDRQNGRTFALMGYGTDQAIYFLVMGIVTPQQAVAMEVLTLDMWRRATQPG